MARILLLRLTPDTTQATWQLVDNGQLVGPSGQGNLSDAKDAARGIPVVVLVPAEEIYLDNISLPGKNRQKLRRAIPYAVEDQLIDDVEAFHFALSTQAYNGHYLVAAVEDRMMAVWDKCLSDAGIRAEVMVPDVAALARRDNGWTILLEEDRALVRTPGSLFATDIASLPIMLENLLAHQEDESGPAVTVYDCSGSDKGLMLQAEAPNIQFDLAGVPQGVFGVFARAYDLRTSVNLLQGEYNREEGWRKQLRPWYAVIVLSVIWLGWQLALSIGNYIDLKHTSDQLSTQIRQVYKQAFPGTKLPLPGYERNDMQAKLKELRRKQGRATSGLQEMLVQTAPVLKKIPGITINGIQYLDGKLQIDLTMQDTNQLESLKNLVQTKTGFDVKSQASTEKGITKVRLVIASNG